MAVLFPGDDQHYEGQVLGLHRICGGEISVTEWVYVDHHSRHNILDYLVDHREDMTEVVAWCSCVRCEAEIFIPVAHVHRGSDEWRTWGGEN